MAELRAAGAAKTREVYLRHGYPEDTYGVRFAVLRRLGKKIGTEHQLARDLWQTGNGEARLLATMIADPELLSNRELDQWVKDITWYVLADEFSGLVERSPQVRVKCDEWRMSDQDFIGQVGWNLVSCLASHRRTSDLPWLESLIPQIEASIHSASNRTRHAMNMALCAIGGHNRELTGAAISAAKRIGHVEVDHGDTGCQTPSAVPYIESMLAHHSGRRRRGNKAARKPITAVLATSRETRVSSSARKVGGKKTASVEPDRST